MAVCRVIRIALTVAVLAGASHAVADAPVAHERSYLLQVEQFEGPWRRQTNCPGYIGRGFCCSNQQSVALTTMRQTLHIDRADCYFVWMRAYADRHHLWSKTRGMSLTLNGRVELQPGTTEIIVRDAEKGYEYADAVLLTNQQLDVNTVLGEHQSIVHEFLSRHTDRLAGVFTDGTRAEGKALRLKL